MHIIPAPAFLQLVELLLDLCNCENIQQAVLQAISENHSSVAELILRHPSYMQICRKRKRLGDTDGFFKTEVESQFSTDMTPLNLAAQKNNFEIVKLLLQRGDTIQTVSGLVGMEGDGGGGWRVGGGEGGWSRVLRNFKDEADKPQIMQPISVIIIVR